MKNCSSYEKVENAIREFESLTHVHVDSSVFAAVQSDFHLHASPLIFLDNHLDYLFGFLYIPESAIDGLISFSRLVLLATNDHLMLFTTCEDQESKSIQRWEVLGLELERSSKQSDVGRKVISVLKFVVEEIQTAIDIHRQISDKIQSEMETSARLSRTTQTSKLEQFGHQLNTAKTEVENLSSLLYGLSRITRSIIDDDLDLVKRGDFKSEEMFPSETEVGLKYQRTVLSQLQSFQQFLIARIQTQLASLNLLQNALQTKASQSVLAVATLGVSPILVLAIYSQFFAEGQRLSSEYSFKGLIIALILVWGVEIAYFARKHRNWTFARILKSGNE
jgi:hypothetical protein